MIWSVFEYSVTEFTFIEAPPTVVWNLVRNMERFPTFLSAVVAVERLRSDSTTLVQPGTRFRRTLIVGKNRSQTITSDITIIQYEDNKAEFPKTMAIYADEMSPRMSGRVSWTVEPIQDSSSSCRLVMNSTILPKKCCLFLGGCAFVPVCLFPKVTGLILKRDLQEFTEAAEASFKTMEDTNIASVDDTSPQSVDDTTIHLSTE